VRLYAKVVTILFKCKAWDINSDWKRKFELEAIWGRFRGQSYWFILDQGGDSQNILKLLKVTKNLMNLPKKFCEFPPSHSFCPLTRMKHWKYHPFEVLISLAQQSLKTCCHIPCPFAFIVYYSLYFKSNVCTINSWPPLKPKICGRCWQVFVVQR